MSASVVHFATQPMYDEGRTRCGVRITHLVRISVVTEHATCQRCRNIIAMDERKTPVDG